jgi:hypothetical protein
MPASSRHISAVLLCLAGLILQGCSPKLDCNNDKVKADVLTIMQDNFDASTWYKRAELGLSGKPEIQNVTTTSKNDELKTAACSAQYTFTYNKTARKIAFDYSLSFLEEKKEVQVLTDESRVEFVFLKLFIMQPPIKNGTQKIYDPKTGKLVQSIQWKDNEPDGNEKMWLSDGTTLIADINWSNGKATGWEKHSDSTGKILTELSWKNGLQTGYQTISLDDGSPVSYTTFKNGKKHGIHRVFSTMSSSGASYVRIEDNYKDDVLDGRQKIYSDGKLKEEGLYKDGMPQIKR